MTDRVEVLRRVAAVYETALAEEGVSRGTRLRVHNYVLYGQPEGSAAHWDGEVPPFESDPVAIALNLTPMPANASYELDRQVECLRRGLRIKQLEDELESANKAASTYLEGLTKRIGELEEALEPFAEAWNRWSAEDHALIGPDMYVDDLFRKLEQAAKAFRGGE